MAPATMYVTVAGAGTGDGLSWTNAFSFAQWETDLVTNSEPGDIYYVKAGTYTLPNSITSAAKDGTAVLPYAIIGVKAATTNVPPVLADWGTTTDKPTFVCAAYTFTFGDYYKVYNCIFTGTATNVITAGAYCVIKNLKASNTYTSTGRSALIAGSYSYVINCECQANDSGTQKGTGVLIGTYSKMIFCYIHDSLIGINLAAGCVILYSIVDTCTTGIDVTSDDYVMLMGNTFYNTTTAVSATDATSFAGINNIIDTTTDGFLWTTQTDSNFFAYNHEGNSVTDMWDLVEESVTAYKDNHVTSGDPDFTDEANGNFSLESTSPCINAGMAITLGVG